MSHNSAFGIITLIAVSVFVSWVAVEKQVNKEERFEQRCWEMNGVIVYANRYYCIKRSVMLEESK